MNNSDFLSWFVSTLINDISQSSKRPSKMVFLLFSNLRIVFFGWGDLERASVSLLMLSAKQENHWYHFFNVFGMTQPLVGIEPRTFALKAITLPLGYWIVGRIYLKHHAYIGSILYFRFCRIHRVQNYFKLPMLTMLLFCHV